MKEYLDCKCGSKETYISCTGDTCCSNCFKQLKEKVVEVVDMSASVFADDGGWVVKINGVVKKPLMKFDPATGDKNPYPSEAGQYRQWHGAIAWLINPYTGTRRDARDVGSDVFGHGITVE